MMLFQSTFIIKKVTVPAVTIRFFEQRLNFQHLVLSLTAVVFDWPAFIPCSLILELHLPIFSPRGSDSLTCFMCGHLV